MARRKNKKTYLYFLFALVLALALFFASKLDIFDQDKPIIELEDTLYSNLKNPLTLKVKDAQSGLSHIKITLKKESGEELVLSDEKLEKQKELSFQINFPKLAFGEKANFYFLQVEVNDSSIWNFFSGNTSSKQVKVIIDEQKPLINIISNSYQIEKGGAASVVFEAKDENIEEIYIENDKGRKFQISPYIKNNFYAALIAWDSKEKDFRAYVIAKDKAGNISKERIRYYLTNRNYKESKITLKDNFLNGKIYDLVQQYAEDKNLNKLERFKFVNEALRLGNEELIHKTASTLSEVDLQNFKLRLFLPLKNAMKVADFADHRFYHYEGEFLSDSYHMGLDLASVAKAPIYVSNPGKVVLARDNGVYGLNVLIDHGFGLFTLYGHCSSKSVEEGDEVVAGDEIAKTGATGLALGDHLHFGILVQGIEVRPEQFQDASWIKNNITNILDEGKKIITGEKR